MNLKYKLLFRPPELKVDENFDQELTAAQQFFPCYFSRNDPALKDSIVIGRYSVLPYYKEFITDLSFQQSSLINSTSQHLFIADMKNWVEILGKRTPKTWFHMEDVPKEGGPFVVKGQTNSCKWQWQNKMFAKTWKDMQKIVFSLQEDLFFQNQQIYIREYVPLKRYCYSIQGLPITEEYRFFVMYGQILTGAYYWSNFSDEFEDGPPSVDRVPLSFLIDVIERIKPFTNFVVIDVARTEDNKWIVIELNDGGMSGLSNNDPFVLYQNMHILLTKHQEAILKNELDVNNQLFWGNKQATHNLSDLRCPECGGNVFCSTLTSATQVLCKDMGHWFGEWYEAIPDSKIKDYNCELKAY